MNDLSSAYSFRVMAAGSGGHPQGTLGIYLIIREAYKCREETLNIPGTKTCPPIKEFIATPTEELIEKPREVWLFVAGDESAERQLRIRDHAASLTDSLIYYQWFKPVLSPAERKAAQKAAKEAAKKDK